MRRMRILFAGFMARMEDTSLPKFVMFGELVGDAGCVGRQENGWMGCFLGDLRPFGINANQWATVAQDGEGWRETADQGTERFVAKWIAAEKIRAGLRYAVVCSNVTERTKDRIAQSKRVWSGSLVIAGTALVTQTCILQAFGLQMSRCLSLVLRLFCVQSKIITRLDLLSNTSPSQGGEITKRLGGIIGCKYKTSSWHLNGFPYGSNIGSRV